MPVSNHLAQHRIVQHLCAAVPRHRPPKKPKHLRLVATPTPLQLLLRKHSCDTRCTGVRTTITVPLHVPKSCHCCSNSTACSLDMRVGRPTSYTPAAMHAPSPVLTDQVASPKPPLKSTATAVPVARVIAATTAFRGSGAWYAGSSNLCGCGEAVYCDMQPTHGMPVARPSTLRSQSEGRSVSIRPRKSSRSCRGDTNHSAALHKVAPRKRRWYQHSMHARPA